MAIVSPQASAKAKVQPPYPLVPAPKTTTSSEGAGEADHDVEDIGRFLHPRADESGCTKKGSRRMRWTALRLETEGTTESVYDALWKALGKEGKRWLSVAKHNGVLRALLYKGDDGEVDLATLPAPATLYGLPPEVAAGGPASRAATAEFARAWLDRAQEATSNFIVESDEKLQATAKETFEDCQVLSDKDFLLSLAAARLPGASPRAQVMKRISPELKALRSVEKKQQKVAADILQDACYRAVEPAGLHMPTDFVDVEAWLGKTWSSGGGAQEMTFLHWLDSPEHLERTAVVYGDSNSGKTAVLNSTARTLAMRYQEGQPYYLCAGTVNGMRSAHRKGLLKTGVPRIIEDYAPKGNPNGHRQSLEEYLVNLLNVKDGGTIDMPGGSQMALPAAAPQLISTNRPFDAWIKKFRKFPLELQHAISKRIVFFRLPDTPLVKAELRKRRQEDMTAMVAAGLERERKFLRARGKEDASTATTPSEVGSTFHTTPSSEEEGEMDDGLCLACEEPSGQLLGGVCPECCVCPPERDEESPDEAADATAGVRPKALPELPRLDEFAAVLLTFAADFLQRVGQLEGAVLQDYLGELRALSPSMAEAYEKSAHCTVSFLTDTTSMKLIRGFLSQGVITQDALYNVVLGQTILPSWRKLEKLGPFSVERPPTPEAFRARHEQHYPGAKAVVPAHLKQGVLSLLGTGPEIDACGRLAQELAAKIPGIMQSLRDGSPDSLQSLGLPAFRELMVLRLLAVADARLCNWNRRDLGDFAQLGLWLLDGMEAGAAREAVKMPLGKAGDVVFDRLLRALPDALKKRDRHGIVAKLEQLGLCPLAAQNVEHMLCEFRKLVLPEGRPRRGQASEDYAELWRQVRPILARRC